jgi:hypothetical protein
MPDYKNGKIYAIRSATTPNYYIGSTSEKYLSNRFSNHKRNFKAGTNRCTSKEILQNDDCYIELVEDFPCESKAQLHRREGEIIREHKEQGFGVLNNRIAGRGKNEYMREVYNKSEVCKISRKKYNETEKGKAYTYKRNNSEEGKASKSAYNNSEKGKAKKREWYLKKKADKEQALN